ncbi:hypothetical protein [Serratia rubidaea]|uniref:Uncharacterized protein n=1 Tax=Serratia rubidaea TaxID=61652 RepID=A0A3S5F2F9_SERRU|nr:hypothetical protein [Serratia rubidaea]MBH1932518.1 hypothetical protein [Serratia rubidaea]MDC6119141.1 hypothetical protein [Serratia rubidaea]MEB7584975.1 hypothetical protein [Serratia rubidaea]VEI70380.1 Uncharacterised protein [Serratia rubidaea]
MSKRSTEDLISFISSGPMTYGFDAVVNMDAEKTNQLLENEYISRTNGNTLTDSIDVKFEAADIKAEIIGSDALSAAPSLRFERSCIAHSSTNGDQVENLVSKNAETDIVK